MNSVTASNHPRLSAQARASGALFLALGCLLYSSVSMAAQLTQQERLQAQNLATSLAWQTTHSSELNPELRGGTDHSHPLAQQTLSIELNVAKHAENDDLVRVYQFDYNSASARMVMVSLSEQRIVSSALIRSAHLPLNADESGTALQWLAADSGAIERLRADQVRRGQAPFDQLNELSVKASIFVPIDSQHECAYHRCALFSVIDKENTVFSMAPVINLQLGTLSWLFP